MMDLGTLQAHIKLEGADGFKSDLSGCAAAAKTVESTVKGLKTSLGGIASAASTGITTAVGGIKTAFNGVKTVVSGVASAVQKIGSIVADVAGKVKDLLVGAFNAARNAALAVSAATMAIGTGITKMVMDNFGRTEQLVGGIETIYGKNTEALYEMGEANDEVYKTQQKLIDAGYDLGQAGQDGIWGPDTQKAYHDYLAAGNEALKQNKAVEMVLSNSDKAYKTVGMSSNEYMENALMLSNRLIQSLGGDTEEAARLTDMAIQDMSDNANKIGTDISMIENAYQGFARGEFRMLDNLRLGYGGTREEMKRLLADAEKLTGQEYSIDSLADIIEAIHAIQSEIGITGTTAWEAAHTIEGSTKAMKAAWKNLLSGIANPTKPVWRLVGDFTNSFSTMLDNLLPSIDTVSDNLEEVIDGLALAIPHFMEKIRPTVRNLAKNVVSELPNIFAGLGETALSFFSSTGRGILAGLPDFFDNLSTNLEGLVPRLRKTFNAFKANIKFNGQDIIDGIGTAWDTLTGEGGVLDQGRDLLVDIGKWVKVKVEGLDLETVGTEVGKLIGDFVELDLPKALDGISWTLDIGSKIMGGIVDELNGENNEMGSGVNSTPLGEALSTFISSAAGLIVISAEAASNLAVSLLDAIGTQLGIVDENGNTAGIESIKTGLGKVFTGLKTSDFETALSGVGDTLIGGIQFTGTAIGGLFRKLFSIPEGADFSETMGAIGDTIARVITFSSDNQREVMKKLFTIDNMKEFVSGVEEFTSGIASGITDAICSNFQNSDAALQIAGSIAYSLLSLPIEVITGLFDGIFERLFGQDWEHTTGLINDELDTAEEYHQRSLSDNERLNQLLEEGKVTVQDTGTAYEKLVDEEGKILAYRSEQGSWTPTVEGGVLLAQTRKEITPVVQQLTDNATRLSEAYRKSGETAAQSVSQVINNEEQFAASTEKATETVEEQGEAIQETTSKATQSFKDMLTTHAQQQTELQKTGQVAEKAITDTVEATKVGAQEIGNITEGTGVVIAEGITTAASTRLRSFVDFAKQDVQQQLEEVRSALEEYNIVREQQNPVIEPTETQPAEQTQETTDMAPKGEEAMSSFAQGLQSGYEGSVGSWLANLGNLCMTSVGSLAASLISKGTELMSGLMNGITTGWGPVQGYLAGTAGRCQAAVGNLSGTLYGAGVALMQGLANGIIAAASSAAAAAAAAVGQVVAAARAAAGIASPSKVFFEIGEFLDEGLALGITNGTGGVLDAINALSFGTQEAFHPELVYDTGATGRASSSASSSVGTTYTIYVDNARVNDDEQIRTRFEDLMIEMARKGMM